MATDDWQARAERAEAALAIVRERHHPHTDHNDVQYCGCCLENWPCADAIATGATDDRSH